MENTAVPHGGMSKHMNKHPTFSSKRRMLIERWGPLTQGFLIILLYCHKH